MKNWFIKNWLYIVLILTVILFVLFRPFLNENSQALMVLITFVYVIATIKISNANIESAKATRDQIIESNKQYENSKHLQILPCFIVSCSRMKRYDYEINLPCSLASNYTKTDSTVLKIENIGKGTARDITYEWIYESIKTEGRIGMVGILEKTSFDINCCFNGDVVKEDKDGHLILHYSDLLGKKYHQEVIIHFITERHGEDNIDVFTNIPIDER
ncbi:MAG: hypothetical protein IJI45_08650 [Anaerolineaceae bacterium]|nr:hypothetical protein [Anaerolineaceae bacterium]